MRMKRTLEKGWSVEIKCAGGTSFLSLSDHGILPEVWNHGNRRFAVARKKDLKAHGFKARVVPVHFCRPEIIPRNAP